MIGRSETYVRQRCYENSCAYVPLWLNRPGRILILDGDVQPLMGGHAGEDGADVLMRAWHGQRTVRIGVVAASLGVSAKTLRRLVLADQLPPCERGWWTWFDRFELIEALLARRVPARGWPQP